jgi:hypothetical protein
MQCTADWYWKTLLLSLVGWLLFFGALVLLAHYMFPNDYSLTEISPDAYPFKR